MKTFYHLVGPAWTRTFRNIWMMEELGLPYSLYEALPQTSGVKKFSEAGKVPILLEYQCSSNAQKEPEKDAKPSFTLTESVAINTYLAGKKPGQTLVPVADTRERALYDQTVLFVLSEMDAQALWVYRKHVALGRLFGHVPEIAEPCRRHFQKMNQIVSRPLERSSYLLGDHFTAADILYVHCLDWAKGYGWNDGWSNHLTNYLERCHQRPAYVKAKAIQKAAKEKSKVQQHQAKENENGRSKL